VNDNLWAFVVPDPCLNDGACYQSFLKYHAEYTSQYGHKVILGLNVKDLHAPFYASALNSQVVLPLARLNNTALSIVV